MAIKFEKIKPGMVLYDRHREQAGNNALSRLGEWPVEVISIDTERRAAQVSWNHNEAETYGQQSLCRLYAWSMYDKDEAERTEGFGGTTSCRRLPAAERKRRKAEREAAAAAKPETV